MKVLSVLFIVLNLVIGSALLTIGDSMVGVFNLVVAHILALAVGFCWEDL